MNAEMLSTDVVQWWGGNFGRRHGSLVSSWASRDARNLFAWAVLAFHVMSRAQEPSVELELIEDEDRWPSVLLIHDGDNHRALDVELRGARLLRLRDEAGAVVASVILGRENNRFVEAIASAVTAAMDNMKTSVKSMESVS